MPNIDLSFLNYRIDYYQWMHEYKHYRKVGWTFCKSLDEARHKSHDHPANISFGPVYSTVVDRASDTIVYEYGTARTPRVGLGPCLTASASLAHVCIEAAVSSTAPWTADLVAAES